MKTALWLFFLVLAPLSWASAQDHDLSCKTLPVEAAAPLSESFYEGYVNAFGFPESGGNVNRVNYLKGKITEALTKSPDQVDALQAQLKAAEQQTAAFSALDLATQHRLYTENQIQLRISYLRPYLQKIGCNISDLDVFAISIYSGSQYKVLNDTLRKGTPEEVAKYQFLIDAINAGLEKLQPYEGVVRRGIALLPPAVMKQYCKGCVVEEKAFTSTTINSSYSKAPLQFVIHSKTGAYIAPLSSAPMEEEVLFKSGTRFKVLSKTKNVITMEEVP